MSTVHDIMQFLLAADGTNQLQRNARALAGSFVQMDARDDKQLLEFILSLAEQIRFYDLNNEHAGDWRPFLSHFIENGEIRSAQGLLELELKRSDWPPHAALLWAFLKVFSVARADMNALTDRHVLYYYQDVLRLPRNIAQPDQVHVLFTPAKNTATVLLEAGALLDAGTSADGTPRQYALDHDIVVTQAAVDRVMSAYADRNKAGRKILFTASDATRMHHEGTVAWRPFGASQLRTATHERSMNAVSVGFSIASPALLMEEGHRTVSLTLALKSAVPPSPRLLTSAFVVEFTSAEGWTTPAGMTARILPGNALQIVATIPEALPAITPHDETLHGGVYDTRWPVMRCRVKPQAYLLEELDGFTVDTAEVSVTVSGVRNLVLQNDQAIQLPDKPILPFTAQPMIGSNLYIGSPEIFHKSLTSLTTHLEWQDPPEDFAEYYSAYGLPGISNNNTFNAHLYLLASRNWNTKLLDGKQGLFAVDTSTRVSIVVNPVRFATAISGSGFTRKPDAPAFDQYHHTLGQGFIKLELIEPKRTDLNNQPPDAPFEAFGHKSFSTVYARQAIALAQFNGGGTPPELPKAAYTPTLKLVSLDYSAREVFSPAMPNGIDDYYIEDLFGAYRPGQAEPARIIPELRGEGALYIGLRDGDVPQGVSMLFQIDEGSTPGETLIASEDMEWSYLSDKGWIRIEAQQVLEDSTKGLQQSGLIRLNLGEDAVQTASRMPSGLHWLRLKALQHADGASSIRDLIAQAARATLSSSGAQVQSELLPENAIASLVRKRSTIKKVEQPYPAFGGRPPEALAMYRRRVSERIRHRNRAVTLWDYERLLLERFPDIFKVKCVPHMDTQSDIVPGAVRAVVVPDWRKRKSGSPLQPAANAAFLREIEDVVNTELTTPFVQFSATNPEFETLLIDTRVAFHPQFDPGFYAQQLEEEIKRFLSPWAFAEGHDIQFGGRVYRSEILAFIEGRAYVDFVIDFQLYHRHRSGAVGGIGQMIINQDFLVGVSPVPTVDATTIGEDFIVGEPVEVAAATRPDTILVSNAYHRINIVQNAGFCTGAFHTGIGQMVVGIDFVPVS